MSKLSFSDLIGSANHSTFDRDIDGLGVVTITEISASECLKHIEEAQALRGPDITEKDHHNHIVKWAGRLLKGSMMTESESAAISDNLSQSALVSIYYAGLEANGKAEESREEIEKN